MINGELSPEFLNAMSPWIIEISSPIIFIALFIYCLRESKREGRLSFGMLLLLSGTSMFWIEWYNDWGAYLLYNPAFQLMPWGSTKWVTPYKPWFMIFSYGWFYYGSMVLMLWLIEKLKSARPQWGHVTCVFVVAWPFFYLWDFWLETSAALTGWWTYVYYFGPAIVSAHGNMPLLHPIVIYAWSGVAMVWVLSYQGKDGNVAFESRCGTDRIQPGFWRESARLGLWCLVMNAIYIVNATIPFIAVREYFAIPNAYVP